MILKTRVAECGCSVDTSAAGTVVVPRRLNRCPLHAAAEEMRRALDKILTLAFKHEVQYWLDAPGTDAERLGQIVVICREARGQLAKAEGR